MKNFILLIMIGFFLKTLFGCKTQAPVHSDTSALTAQNSLFQYTMNTLTEQPQPLADYKGKVILVVNVASKCGLTPQYKDIEALYEKYKDRGLVVLGFPANNFLSQEPGSNADIQEFCTKNYGVSFPMFSKISVKGKDMDPLYQFITQKAKNGVMDSEVSWNFQKYLFNKEGHLITYFAPTTKVTEAEVITLIEKELSK